MTELFEKNKPQEKHSLCKALFKFLASLYTKKEICLIGFKLIFNSFTHTFKNFTAVYKMFLILIEISGFDIKNVFHFSKVKYQFQEPTITNSLNIINELLDVISKIKVDLECKINDIAFNNFIKNLLMSVIALTKVPNTSCYQIFSKVIDINPLIIESIINETLTYIMLSDNSQCKKEYEELLIKIFEVFSKLHRIQNLISKMIPTLKSGVEDRKLNESVYIFKGELDLLPDQESLYSIDNIFPKSVLNYFTNCIINLASWQVINLFKTLLFHLNKAVEDMSDRKEGITNI